MAPEILVIAECCGVELDPITFDLVSWGSKIAAEKSWSLGIVVLGFELSRVVEEISSLGIDQILVLDDARLQEYNSSVYVAVITPIVQQSKPRLVLVGHTYMGIEIGAAMAPKVEAPLVSNCQSVEAVDGCFLVTRPMFGGKFFATIKIDDSGPVLIGVAKGTAPGRNFSPRACESISLSLPSTQASNVEVIREIKPAHGQDITKAQIIVALGRGIQDRSRISSFRELAKILGGAIAASRPIVDCGWLTRDYQVGLSGLTVRPKVYLACGISGSAQHIAGMKESGLIIAINKDASAPIFQIAHCGVVADLLEILPALLLKAQETREGEREEGGVTKQ
jgi:electron transfer flavoprotein alpha subunit